MRLRAAPTVIHVDQNGQGFHDERLFFKNKIHECDDSPDSAISSIDAEKAFDRVEWLYLFEVLKGFGFGDIFRRWIEILLADSSAMMCTNFISHSLELFRGNRQGSPISPFYLLWQLNHEQ